MFFISFRLAILLALSRHSRRRTFSLIEQRICVFSGGHEYLIEIQSLLVFRKIFCQAHRNEAACFVVAAVLTSILYILCEREPWDMRNHNFFCVRLKLFFKFTNYRLVYLRLQNDFYERACMHQTLIEGDYSTDQQIERERLENSQCKLNFIKPA
jgi:hypothetical protein